MSDIQLDSSGDILVDNGEVILMTDTLDIIKQRLQIRLQTFKGEWFLNPNVGLPYFQEILKKGTDITIVDNIFRSYIENTRDIKEITNFKSVFNHSDRTYTLDFDVTTYTNLTFSINNLRI